MRWHGGIFRRIAAICSEAREPFAASKPSLFIPAEPHVRRLLPKKGSLLRPVYATDLGMALCGDSLAVLKKLPPSSVDLVITSPPYALHFKKEYGNVDKDGYVKWLLPFAREIRRVLKEDGSFVLNIGGSYNPAHPTRSLYHFKLAIALCERIGFPSRPGMLLVQSRQASGSGGVGERSALPDKG